MTTNATTSMTIQVDNDLKENLMHLAKLSNRSTAFHVRQALEDYLDVQACQLEGIKEGQKAAEEGRTVSLPAVKSWMRSWGTENECQKPVIQLSK